MAKCGCGSGLERRALTDGRGLFCDYVCDQCEDRKRAKYRPVVMNTFYSEADVDEPIEEE